MPDLKTILKESLKNFVDSLNKFIFILCLIFLGISFFVKNFYIDLIKVLLFIIFLFRLFSKNKAQRQKENAFYQNIKQTLSKPFTVMIKNKQDKNHVYKCCPKCRTILKLPIPSKRGFKHASCPNCHKRLSFFTLKEEKIIVEVIKKNK